jgi:hypothetical protein
MTMDRSRNCASPGLYPAQLQFADEPGHFASEAMLREPNRQPNQALFVEWPRRGESKETKGKPGYKTGSEIGTPSNFALLCLSIPCGTSAVWVVFIGRISIGWLSLNPVAASRAAGSLLCLLSWQAT